MPHQLKRITGRGDLHFITFCCYQQRPLLASARIRNLAVQILKEVRARYGFALDAGLPKAWTPPTAAAS